MDVHQLTERLVAAIEAKGGRVLTETALESIAIGDDGIADVTVTQGDGGRRSFRARSVIIATGGFGGSQELLERYMGPHVGAMLLRANPRNTGDGLRAALGAGARTSPSMWTFYGHTMPGLPADPPPAQWVSVTQYYSQDAILVNAEGRRFFDESRSMADETAPFEIVRQPGGVAWLVMDRRVHDDVPLPGRSRSRAGQAFANAVAAGAPTVTADTIEALADGLAAMGVDRAGFLATIDEFNRAIAAGDGVRACRSPSWLADRARRAAVPGARRAPRDHLHARRDRRRSGAPGPRRRRPADPRAVRRRRRRGRDV